MSVQTRDTLALLLVAAFAITVVFNPDFGLDDIFQFILNRF